MSRRVNSRAGRALLFVAMLLGGALALILVDACTIINGLTVGQDGGAVGDAADGGDSAVDPCVHTYPPAPRPPEPNSLPGSELFVAVATDVSFGIDGGAFEAISFDLDGLCTCFPHEDTCKPNLGEKTKCDQLGGGQDNAAQELFRQAKNASLDLQQDAKESVEKGGRAILIRVDGYNGLPNDPEVSVSVLVSPGHFVADVKTQPSYSTADLWSVDMKAVYDKGGILIPFDTKTGYVVDGTLVVGPISISVPVADVALLTVSAAVLVGKIEPAPGGGFTLGEARFAGRWSNTEAAKVLGSFERQTGTGAICDGTDDQNVGLYKFFKQSVCQASDLRALPKDDRQGLACDAISMAVTFKGKPASLGTPREVIASTACATATIDCSTAD